MMAQTPDSFYIITVVNAFCHTINPSRLVKGVIALLALKADAYVLESPYLE